MTREEAIKRLKEARNTIQPFRYVDEAIDYAIKALEQEPCDDCVSRQAVIAYLKRTYNSGMGKKKSQEYNIEYVSKLPSVNPTREHGEWLETETSYADGVRQYCRCSKCGLQSLRPLGNFCRWCGADMKGGEDAK